MGRKLKFSDAELRELTRKCIDKITYQGQIEQKITRKQIVACMAKIGVEGFEYSDACKPVVFEEIAKHNKQLENTGVFKDANTDEKKWLQNFSAKKVLKENYTTMPLTLETAERNIRLILQENSLLHQKLEVYRAKTQLEVAEELKMMTEKIEQLQKNNNAMLITIQNYEKELKDLNECAAMYVIRDCRAADLVIEVDENTSKLAKEMTYLAEKENEDFEAKFRLV